MSISYCVLCTFLFGAVSSQTNIRNMVVYSAADSNLVMQKVVVYNRTREVYVGARNAIYHFDQNLRLKNKVSTGPVLDHPECLHPTASKQCDHERVPTDDDVRVLSVRYGESDWLLACGTVFQGMCRVRPLYNINVNHWWVGDFNDSRSFVAGRESTVAFFGPGVTSATSLYSASTYDGRPTPYSPPSVASRVLWPRKKGFEFRYTYSSETSVSSVNFEERYKKLYKVNYIYGFSHGNFAYFVTTQRAGVRSEVMETRLVRVCNDDPAFFSYMEVPMTCQRGVDKYTLASAAHLGVSDNFLKRHLKLDGMTDVLYVAFTMTTESGHMADKSRGSVLCSFPMSEILSFFTNETKECYMAEPRTHLLEHVLGLHIDCIKRTEIVINDDFCGSGFNHYIEGKSVIPGGFRAHVQSHITSLAVILQMGKAVAILGTEEGEVVKVDLSSKKQIYSVPLGDSSDNSTPARIESSYAFDASYENIYLLTGNKVVKFPVGSCSVYTVCGLCLKVDDPLGCGWCGSYCARYDECETPDHFSKTSCPPVIESVTPLQGPTDGGTLVTILGDNFGSSQNGVSKTSIEVSVAGQPCSIVKWMRNTVECKTGFVKQPISGPVVIKVQDFTWADVEFDMNGTTTSSQNFSYLVPKLYGIYPAYGPMSGGTNITLLGENMNIGTKHQVTVARVPCVDFRLFPNTSWCVTGRLEHVTAVTRGPVELVIDDVVVEPEAEVNDESVKAIVDKEFEYRLDPEISEISPHATTVSGTTNLTVVGTNLNSVANPKIVVIVTSSLTGQKMEIQRSCNVTDGSGTKMVCPTPSIKISGLHTPTERAPLVSHMAFIMDGNVKLRELPLHNRDLSQLLYYPDPEYVPFDDPVVPVDSENPALEIRGRYLNLAHTASDVKVLIGGEVPCNVTELKADSLTCSLPSLSSLKPENGTEHSVEVFIGSLGSNLGLVKFVARQPEGTSSNDELILAVIAVVLVTFVSAVVVYIVFKWILGRVREKRSTLRYIVAFSGNENENTRASQRRQDANDYHDLNGRSQTRRPSAAPTVSSLCNATSAVSEVPAMVDDETMRLLQSEDILIHRNFLSLGDVIGEGYFGRVYKGLLTLPGKQETIEVAVKTLHNSSAAVEQNVEAFLQEGLMMKDFHHHNVLTLIGVCFETGGNPMVIIPYMKYGDLLSYMRDEQQSPTVKDLLSFGVQVAYGMKYLSELKFVHRDLAARNCMLDSDYTVKVADFGLSRDIYEREYYSSDNRKTKLPVKWMAIESLEKGTYNTKTDVWSYGVVLWELMTRGVTPYPDVDNWDIVPYLKSGRRMPQPSYCPDLLYGIMLRCWSADPADRPTFAELAVEVQGIITKLEMEYKQRKVGLDVTYVNYPQVSGEHSGASSRHGLT